MFVWSALLTVCLGLIGASVAQAQSTDEMNKTGWTLLQRGDGARAARVFAEALALEPDDPVLLFGAGAAAHLNGRPTDAVSHLRRALDLNPALTPASILFGEIAYAEGDVALAITT